MRELNKATIIGMLVVLGLGNAIGAAPQIEIDGKFNDWASIRALPIQASDSGVKSKFGLISAMKVASDEDFIYAYLSFVETRMFDPVRQYKRLKRGRSDDFSYLELDLDADGKPDIKTRMVPGKRQGRNNLLILKTTKDGRPARTFLQPEGHKDYVPLGPKAFFSPLGDKMEMRIPRLPLEIYGGRTLFRALVRYRHPSAGVQEWRTAPFPPGGKWLALDLGKLDPENLVDIHTHPESINSSPSRKNEPVMLRDEIDLMQRYDMKRYVSRYVYPTPLLSAEIKAGAAEQNREKQTEAKADPNPIFVVTPEGNVKEKD